MTQSNAYWKRRAARNEARSGERSLSLIAELLRQYELAKVKLRREVNDFYARYADEDGISYADAVKRLNNAELTEWRYELGKYVEDINAETDSEVKRRLISELNARSYGSRITRLTVLEGQINAVTASLFSEGVAKAKATFGEVFTEGYFRTSYDLQCRSGFAREIAGIDEKLIEEVLSYRYDGQDFSSRIWKNKTALALNLKNTLTDSLIRGKSAAETAAALAKQTDVSFRSAARLVRTETNRFHNEGAMRAYSEAGIEYYEFIATYDARTCDECSALDGKRFKLSEKEPGVNFPPIHPNDRCTTVAYDPDWDDGKAVEKLCGGYEEWKAKYSKRESGISGKHEHKTSENTVNLDYINSKEYKAKFDKITNNSKVNQAILKYSKAILTHRNGTYYEDLYLIDAETGELFANMSRATAENIVTYTDELRRALYNNPGRFISIHNHGTNNPPTGSDIVSASEKKYIMGIVVCHDGSVFKYTPSQKPLFTKLFSDKVEILKKRGYTEREAIGIALNEAAKTAEFEWSEL